MGAAKQQSARKARGEPLDDAELEERELAAHACKLTFFLGLLVSSCEFQFQSFLESVGGGPAGKPAASSQLRPYCVSACRNI